MTNAALPHPSDIAIPELGPHHLADPRLWDVAAVDVIDDARSFLNIKYEILPGWRPLTLDLHVPRLSNTSNKGRSEVPVVMYAHGGSFVGGVKEMGPWASLPRRGIAVASIDYRLAGEVSYPGGVHDILAAIRWVRSNAATYGLDPHRIAGWGSSAGGYLMGRAALDGNEDSATGLSALVLHYTPSDFAALHADSFEPTDESQQAVTDVISVFLGVSMFEHPDLDAVSLTHAVATGRQFPPVWLAHGDADHRCGVEQAHRLHRAIDSAGGESTVQILPGADHADPIFVSDTVIDPTVDFLNDAWARWTAPPNSHRRDP